MNSESSFSLVIVMIGLPPELSFNSGPT